MEMAALLGAEGLADEYETRGAAERRAMLALRPPVARREVAARSSIASGGRASRCAGGGGIASDSHCADVAYHAPRQVSVNKVVSFSTHTQTR